MSLLNILIYVIGGIIILIYGFFAIRKYLKWKKIFKELINNGHSVEVAKNTADEQIYKKTKKHKNNENKDTPFIE